MNTPKGKEPRSQQMFSGLRNRTIPSGRHRPPQAKIATVKYPEGDGYLPGMVTRKRLRAPTASERSGIAYKEGGLGTRPSSFGCENSGWSEEGCAGADTAKVTMTASGDNCSAEGNEGGHKEANQGLREAVREPDGMIRDCLNLRKGKCE